VSSDGSRFWSLGQEIPSSVVERAETIHTVVFDVDGVLTDGGLYYGPNGEELKRFNTQDGHGIKLLLNNNINVALVTARSSPALETRVKELGIEHFYPGRHDKLKAFEELCAVLNCSAKECCYVGDDLLDLPIMVRCGLAVTVANGNHVTKRVAHWITTAPGGSGAVREVCELILYAHGKLDAVVEAYLR